MNKFFSISDGDVIATKDSILDQSRMSLEGGDLQFDRTITSDTGTYMCIADNGVGVANATVSLGVYGEYFWMCYLLEEVLCYVTWSIGLHFTVVDLGLEPR